MNIILEGPEQKLETNGQGDIIRGKARAMDDSYAYDLVVSGRVKLADDASRVVYDAIRKQRITEAAEQGKTVYCDGCYRELDAKQFLTIGCPFCSVSEGKE